MTPEVRYLYAFIKTMDTYRKVIGENDTLVLSTGSDLFEEWSGILRQREEPDGAGGDLFEPPQPVDDGLLRDLHDLVDEGVHVREREVARAQGEQPVGDARRLVQGDRPPRRKR